MSFSENKHMNDDEFVLQLFKIIEKKVDMLPDTYVKKSYAEDIMQHCFVRLWQNHKTGVLDKNFWAFAEVCVHYGVRSQYLHYCNRAKNEILCGEVPQNFSARAIWAENAFIPQNFIYEQWLDLCSYTAKRGGEASYILSAVYGGEQVSTAARELEIPYATAYGIFRRFAGSFYRSECAGG